MAETTRSLLAPCRDCADRDTCALRPEMERGTWRWYHSWATRLYATYCLWQRVYPACYTLHMTCARWRSHPMTIVPVMQTVQTDTPETA